MNLARRVNRAAVRVLVLDMVGGRLMFPQPQNASNLLVYHGSVPRIWCIKTRFLYLGA